jgi:hypothetical protein
MSTTAKVPTHLTPSAPTPTAQRQPVCKHGLAAAVVASAVTTVLAAVASAAGVSFADRTGASIPIAGFAQLTLVLSLVGAGIAAVTARTAHRPRPTFVRTTGALTALSFVPDLTFGFDVASATTLITLHTGRRGDRGPGPGETVPAHPLTSALPALRSTWGRPRRTTQVRSGLGALDSRPGGVGVGGQVPAGTHRGPHGLPAVILTVLVAMGQHHVGALRA